MAYHGKIPESDKKRLAKLWEQSGHDWSKLEELKNKDGSFRNLAMTAIRQRIREAGLSKGVKFNPRFIFKRQFTKEERLQVDKDCADDNLSWDEIAAKYSNKKRHITVQMLKSYATREHIKTNKKNGYIKAKKAEPKSLSIDELIAKREHEEITVEEFANELEKRNDLFSERWKVIHDFLKEKRILRSKQLLPFSKQLKISGKKSERQNNIRGILRKVEELGLLSSFKQGTFTVYLCNLPDFYKPEEVADKIPAKEINLVLERLREARKAQKLSMLAEDLEKIIGCNLLSTLLDYYVSKGVLQKSVSGKYKATQIGLEYGFDENAIKTLGSRALENCVALQKKDEAAGFKFTNLGQITRAQMDDLRAKEVKPVILPERKILRVSALGEILYGNQFSDNDLIQTWLELQKKNGIKPDIAIITGLVQGNFLGYRVDKNRILTREQFMNEIGPQHSAAELLMQSLEELVTDRVFYQQGDDDWDLAVNYALIARAAERGIAHHGVSNLSPETRRYLINTDYYRKLYIQWEVIQKYMYLIGRSLMNKDEVYQIIGVMKSEYRLIIEILTAQESNLSYPKEYEKIVDVKALKTSAIGKRFVTPDPLLLKFGKFAIQATHNLSFSDVTQYVDSVQIPEMNVRARQVFGEKTPTILVDFHQERLYFAKIGSSVVMNLPGCQNTNLANRWQTKTFYSKVLSSKSHRQITFRKEPVSPGITNLEILEDGRIRLNILNRKILDVINTSGSDAEIEDSVAYISDTQFGSISTRAEILIKYMDYSLYERGANILLNNGDILHTINYPQTFAENRPDRLVSVDSQQRFMVDLMVPIIVDAPALKKWMGHLGNHEWNVFGGGITGQNNLNILEMALRYYFQGLQKAGKLDKNVDISLLSRIRFLKSGNPTGDHLNWPYTSLVLPSGYKLAMQHMWQRGGGRTPVEQMIRWVKNMAEAASDLHIMYGGHWHCLWGAMVYNILMVQVPAAAGLSGYELQLGKPSQVMFVHTTFSNKKGITIEIVPWEFLMNEYKCQSPKYKGRDEALELPKPGTSEYKHGKHSPLIEEMIDNVTWYTEV